MAALLRTKSDVDTQKEIAVSFLRLAATGRAQDAFSRHVAGNFLHHNPFFDEHASALMAGMDENARRNPEHHFEVQRALEDGDFVAVHSHIRQKPGDRGMAVVHIFRFEGNRIAELWDIGQPVPAETVNALGMF